MAFLKKQKQKMNKQTMGTGNKNEKHWWTKKNNKQKQTNTRTNAKQHVNM